MEAGGLKTVRANWTGAILICGKCSKKIGGGFGPDGRTSLAKALRRELGAGKGRKSALGVVEVKCLGICPKQAVTVLNGAAPGAWLVVPRGAATDAVIAGLRLAAAPLPPPPAAG